MTLMMTSAQFVETSANVTSNSPSQDYTHPDDQNLLNYNMTPGFKPFTVEELKAAENKQMPMNELRFVLKWSSTFLKI